MTASWQPSDPAVGLNVLYSTVEAACEIVGYDLFLIM